MSDTKETHTNSHQTQTEVKYDKKRLYFDTIELLTLRQPHHIMKQEWKTKEK